MNCKQGDLAVVVKSHAGNEGKVLTCIRLATLEESRPFNSYQWPLWVTDVALMTDDGFSYYFASDAQLCPLRDNDGEDEMLRIAGKPEVITQ